jgi:L-seryl-tRNA(Ser) seleniumtransferase
MHHTTVMPRPSSALRALPSIDRLLRHPGAVALCELYSRTLVTQVLREVLNGVREAAASGGLVEIPDSQTLLDETSRRLDERIAATLRPVVNATGVVLHTNLGRAALAEEAIRALEAAARGPVNLEYDLSTGNRGHRDAHLEGHLQALTGAEAATVVNNNAAAVLLALNTLAESREVVVSRGELIEIGGSFRMPDIITKSGCRLKAVGTTNRTHPSDYERAIGPETAMLLKVHTSNYRIVGFASEVSLTELVAIGRTHSLPVMEDLGSGALVDLGQFGLPKEPVVAERVHAGADVVTFSGDKLLGGPQAGVIVGRQNLIERMRQNPLKRALRCDKLTTAALEATLRLYRAAPDLTAVLPTLRALTRPMEEMEAIGRAALPLLQGALGAGYEINLVDSASEIGSGALPTEALPTRAIAISHPQVPPLGIAARFRNADPPIIGRVHDNRFLLDLRCIRNPADLIPLSPVL